MRQSDAAIVIREKKWLEDKWWYRLLKVGYLAVGIPSLVFGPWTAFNEGMPRTTYFSTIQESLTTGSWSSAVIGALVTFFGVLFFLWLIRGIFYYVVCGKFNLE